MTAVWAVALIHTDKLVLLALADNANDEGLCWPSVMTLTHKCGMDARTVQRVVTRLCDAGHVTVHERQGKSNYYTVHPRRSAAPAECHPGTQPPTPGVAPPPPPAQRRDPPGVAPPINIIEPPVEPSGNRQGAKKAKHLPEDFQLTEKRRAVARTEQVDPDREFQTFRDHWNAASGARARKRDWDAAWRIWCRQAADYAARGPAGAQRRASEDRAREEARELQQLQDGRAEMGLAHFRGPLPHESPAVYRTALNLERNRLGVPRIAADLAATKRVPT